MTTASGVGAASRVRPEALAATPTEGVPSHQASAVPKAGSAQAFVRHPAAAPR